MGQNLLQFLQYDLRVPLLKFRLCLLALLTELTELHYTYGYATLNASKLEDNAICASVLLGLLNEGYFLGDF